MTGAAQTNLFKNALSHHALLFHGERLAMKFVSESGFPAKTKAWIAMG
jgi:hypothetical protein